MSSRPGRVVRAALSLVLLLGVIVGVPLLLVAMDLVPAVLPSLDQARSALMTRDDGQLLRVVLGAVAWVCWLLFTAATVGEVVALLRARPAPPLPGLQAFQRPAAALVAAVVLGLTVGPTSAATTSSDLPPLPAASTAVQTTHHVLPSPALRVVASAMPAVVSDAELPRYEVQRRDTLWAIAESHLGDPLRYPEIVRLNSGAVGPDNRIVPGSVLVLPADAVGVEQGTPTQTVAAAGPAEVTVEDGDTLWGLAEATTGDGANWPAVWEANHGRVQPDGAVFDDPDVLRPGWTITVPMTVEAAPAPTVPAPSAPAPAPSTQNPDDQAPVPTTARPPAPTSTGAEAAQPSTAASPSVDAPSANSDDGGEAPPVVQVLGGGALLAGVSLLALNRYRRRQFRHRRPGRRIPRPPGALASLERGLAAAGAADVQWLDTAVRSLIQAAPVDGHLPDVVAVSMTNDVLSLVLAVPSTDAPHPWTVDTTGLRWSVLRGEQLPHSDAQRARIFSPFPTLISVGSTSAGEQWLIDLERMGTLRITGDLDRGRDLLRFMAAELAHNTWSEMLSVTAVGLGAELADLNPDRLVVVDDGERAVDDLLHRQSTRTRALDRGHVLDSRLRGPDADAWAPQLVLLGDAASVVTETAIASLRDLGHQGSRTGIAVALVGSDGGQDDGWTLDVDRHGHGCLPALGIELRVHQLPIAEAAPLAQLLAAAAATDDRSLHPTAGTEPADEREAGAVPNGEPEMARPFDGGAATSDSVLPLPDAEYLLSTATTASDVRILAPATDEARRTGAEAADAALDQDLADWADQTSTRPKLTLLGPVAVRAQGSLPERNPRRSFYTEVVAYLASRPNGATSEQYATAMWPDEPDVIGKTKVRQSISVVRTWLGADDGGSDYLPSGLTAAAGGRYRINGAIVDADLFRRLRVRGVARGAPGITDLEGALGLVRGRPFELPDLRVRGVGGYGWLLDDGSRMDLELAAVIVDVAHVVATHHLGNGEPERAAAAAQVALRSGTFEDVPLLDLVAACDARGNRVEADTYVARILANHDAEVEEDLPPRTAEVLFRRSRR